MIDVKSEVRDILSGLDGVCVRFYMPPEDAQFPLAVYFELSRVPKLMCDNTHGSFVSTVQLDAWDTAPAGADSTGGMIEEAMRNNGWMMILSRDLFDNEEGLWRRNMKFIKEFFEEE